MISQNFIVFRVGGVFILIHEAEVFDATRFRFRGGDFFHPRDFLASYPDQRKR